MKNHMRMTAVLAASLFALAALGPVSQADPANDGLTRSFGAVVGAELEFKNRGTGIYDPGATQVCPVSLLGLRAVVGDVFYYQTGRVTTNVKAGNVFVTGAGLLPPGGLGSCPLPGTNPGNQFVWVEDMHIWGPYTALNGDQLLCGQNSFLDCFPQPGTAYMAFYKCDGATFTSNPGSKHVLGGTGLESALLSRSASCTGTSNGLVYINGTGGVSTDCDFSFGEGGWGTGFCLFQVEDHVPTGSGSGYVVNCASVTYDWFDFTAIPVASGTASAAAHDYTLVLDAADPGAPTSYTNALTTHVGSTGGVGHVALQGLYDLGGSNDCPGTQPTDAYDADAKKDQANVVSEAQDCPDFPPDLVLPDYIATDEGSVICANTPLHTCLVQDFVTMVSSSHDNELGQDEYEMTFSTSTGSRPFAWEADPGPGIKRGFWKIGDMVIVESAPYVIQVGGVEKDTGTSIGANVPGIGISVNVGTGEGGSTPLERTTLDCPPLGTTSTVEFSGTINGRGPAFFDDEACETIIIASRACVRLHFEGEITLISPAP